MPISRRAPRRPRVVGGDAEDLVVDVLQVAQGRPQMVGFGLERPSISPRRAQTFVRLGRGTLRLGGVQGGVAGRGLGGGQLLAKRGLGRRGPAFAAGLLLGLRREGLVLPREGGPPRRRGPRAASRGEPRARARSRAPRASRSRAARRSAISSRAA